MLRLTPESQHPGLPRQENTQLSEHPHRRRQPPDIVMLRIETRQARHAPNLLRKTAGMLRLAHERLPLTVGMLRLGAESEHPEGERSRRTAESAHLCLAWTR